MSVNRKLETENLIGGVPAQELASAYGTPLYVIDAGKVRENYNALGSAFGRHYRKTRIYYAAKANTNLALLRLLRELGSRVDVVSIGELRAARLAGFSGNKIIFTSGSVNEEEAREVVRSGAIFNIDSTSIYERVRRIGLPTTLSFRFNPGIGAGHHEHCVTGSPTSKFGMSQEENDHSLERLYLDAKKHGVKRFGIHMHIGSGITETEPYGQAMDRLFALIARLDNARIRFEFIDIGGGIGIAYRPDEKVPSIGEIAEGIAREFAARVKESMDYEPELFIEPGRSIVANAGYLLVRVNCTKEMAGKNYAIVDGGINALMRPILYGSYHHIRVDGKSGLESRVQGSESRVPGPKTRDSKLITYDIVGPMCESGDFLGRERKLPTIAEGDLIVIENAGAYGFAMANNYNSHPLPAEVMAENGKHRLVRRRQIYEQLFENCE
ncbi:diaminopimelate decarboxylase [Candidatus Micrarchaeota archaeon CG08_land_8_20_14_0_20_49_17]|nr:MAG: diaminopimelate decarboxylase [Candidatus Micrarchaeota archaeon CG1_02_49_24]PIU09513.1 MAG: diaminopimelate decarboxylase [Candidatus Micrarchaeota archaeon CG08_land_8_20_14_0_20_49_17]PIZ99297.1 MAG: diaminopimelate decarboxylase [Candidatus Micrarchaeota archaeon CG_4_10_14_0_2_um_filter_49_7]HII54117.1 diaminopimelate decarboxylase [Candidatus Micrarchaeota archaeon]